MEVLGDVPYLAAAGGRGGLRRSACLGALLFMGGCALTPQPALDMSAVRAIEHDLTQDIAANKAGAAAEEAMAGEN